jgi:anhydro-N-acetylmuramic acid kinase
MAGPDPGSQVSGLTLSTASHRWIAGLMSGTSLDGIDVALLKTDGERVLAAGPSFTFDYDDAFRARLRALLGGEAPPDQVRAVEAELTDRHAEAVRRLLRLAKLATDDLELVGFHGQTILHAPHQRLTWQIGDGRRLAAALGLPVVNDFRGADVAAGGQGAPLVPVFHRALAAELPKPLAVLNIGGVANVTFIGEGDLLVACDTGPGNALLDDWILRLSGQRADLDGRVSAAGRAREDLVERLLAHPFFAQPLPKSLDRDAFDVSLLEGLGLEEGAATLVAFTAGAVARVVPLLPARPREWLVTGGGRLNPTLMQALAKRLGVPVRPVEAVGWDGDALEAQAFAFLAARSRRGLPLSYPGTTGVPAAMPGGRLSRP